MARDDFSTDIDTEEEPTMLANGRKAPPPETGEAVEAVVQDPITKDIIQRYNVTDARLAELRQKNQGLTIAGLHDKAGYELVHNNRMELVKLRGTLELKRKELKADSLEYGRKVDGEAKRIQTAIEAIEAPLDAEEKRINALEQAEKDAAQKVINDRAERRRDALLAVDAVGAIHPLELATMPESDFQAHLTVATTEFKAKKEKADKDAADLARLQAEEAERKLKADAEAKRVAEENAAERARLDAQKKAQDEAQAKLDADKKAIEDAKKAEADAKAKAEEIERAKVEAAAKAVEEQKRKDKEAADAAAKAKAEADAEAKRQAELAPDKAKLKAYADAIRAVPQPTLKSAKLQTILADFSAAIAAFGKAI